jgi:hypothetical protein
MGLVVSLAVSWAICLGAVLAVSAVLHPDGGRGGLRPGIAGAR